MTPKELAVFMHDTYETLAPNYGYTTREDTREFDPTTANGQLMVAVASTVLTRLTLLKD